ncbi:hypothetical protein FKP32DRAFT_1443132 [Trametes sanguinea]|nr:hypothetical protein FKP32DRAFT_1443132 [Trametes sanguinea]
MSPRQALNQLCAHYKPRAKREDLRAVCSRRLSYGRFKLSKRLTAPGLPVNVYCNIIARTLTKKLEVAEQSGQPSLVRLQKRERERKRGSRGAATAGDVLSSWRGKVAVAVIKRWRPLSPSSRARVATEPRSARLGTIIATPQDTEDTTATRTHRRHRVVTRPCSSMQRYVTNCYIPVGLRTYRSCQAGLETFRP